MVLAREQLAKNGILALLRVVVLFRRKDPAEFICIPSFEVKLDMRSEVYTLFNLEKIEDNITFDPEFEPFIVMKMTLRSRLTVITWVRRI